MMNNAVVALVFIDNIRIENRRDAACTLRDTGCVFLRDGGSSGRRKVKSYGCY